MTFFEFMDIKYQEVSIKLGNNYSLFSDGRAKAIHALIGASRIASKWLHFPILISEFIIMKIGLKAPPVSPLAAEKEAAKAAKAANLLKNEFQ